MMVYKQGVNYSGPLNYLFIILSQLFFFTASEGRDERWDELLLL